MYVMAVIFTILVLVFAVAVYISSSRDRGWDVDELNDDDKDEEGDE